MHPIHFFTQIWTYAWLYNECERFHKSEILEKAISGVFEVQTLAQIFNPNYIINLDPYTIHQKKNVKQLPSRCGLLNEAHKETGW